MIYGKKKGKMMVFTIIKKNKGFSLIEILVSAAMTMFIFLSLIQFFSNTEKQIKDISDTSVSSKNSVYLIQSILSQSKNYQFYPSSSSDNKFANIEVSNSNLKNIYDTLAFFISKDGDIKSIESCISNQCIRRLGISLVPVEISGARGLFKVWILGLKPKDSNPNDYETFLDKKMIIPLI